MTRFIVGEVSKNWTGWEANATPRDFICAKFEEMIEHNLQRGYVLHSFQLHRLLVKPGELNETIVAVFEFLGE